MFDDFDDSDEEYYLTNLARDDTTEAKANPEALSQENKRTRNVTEGSGESA
ncbi:hypothetical protein PF005_g5683 [Phytophthora fragariae]|nr:hypothetical protein PF003_g30039 [Phytophthora fragariae]KAE8935725.1 hypothetical protein PF009_g14336 [Phytophthora fragariae]KAE8985537.1 hypothetical protein PF011_g20353 [Phytophthora fragariae]KAE9083820.1 hypothetical protein PF007_g21753 [Phytophthora fragariae]KAE9087664.1 hypothetical protein PF010_g19647 [Phytophthora fragariae]